jgi:hypothetical protein
MLKLCLSCPLLLDLLLHDLSSLHNRPSSGHVLLHELKVSIFLVIVCQLIFYDGFNFILRVLMMIFLSFSFFVRVLVVVLSLLQRRRWEIWGSNVGCEHLCLSRWLPHWSLGPPHIDDSSMRFNGCVWVACLGYVGS